jgi:hypothetical protein
VTQINLSFTAPQLEAYKFFQPGNTLCLAHGRGLGKSWFVRRLAYLLIAAWEYKQRITHGGGVVRGVRVVFLLPTFLQFKHVHSRLMEQELSDEWAFLGAKIDHTTWTVTFPGGSTIQVFPASEHGSQRARGIRCDCVFTDECDDVDESVNNAVVQPWLTEPWSLNLRVFTGTPKRGRHGLLYANYKRGQHGAELRNGVAPVNVDPEIYDTLRSCYSSRAWYIHAPEVVDIKRVHQARATMPLSTFKREYESDFDSAEGRVYPFDENFHVRTPPENAKFNEYIVGGDHGWADPGVFLLIGILGHGKDAVAWILEEVYATEKPNSWWNEQALRIIRGGVRTFYLDPSRPDRIKDICDLGANAIGADNNIDAGIARVANMLVKHPTESGEEYARLYVHPRCVNTIREFCEYRRKKDPHDDERFLEDVEDKNNHCMDSVRYSLVMRFGRLENGKTVVNGR